MRRTRIPLSAVRACLEQATRDGVSTAAAAAGVCEATVINWRRHRAESGGTWPTDDDIAEWHREHQRTAGDRLRGRRYRLRAMTAREPLTLSPVGTQRRLRALMAIGHRLEDVSALTGIDTSRLGIIARGACTWVKRDTHDRVSAAYEQLSGSPGPSRKTRSYARNRGWAAPLAWDDDTIDDPAAQPVTTDPVPGRRDQNIDEVAVYRATHGDRVTLTTAERRAAVLLLARRGASEKEIAETLRINFRLVARDKAAA